MRRPVFVVLGAAVRPGGVASPALKRRVDHAASLALGRPDSLLLLTGGVGLHPPSEAEVMAAAAERAGVARERMLLEQRATNTRESARLCAALLRQHPECEDCEVWLVTDAYHQRRARLAFRRVGLEAQPASPDSVSTDRASRDALARRVLREWIGYAWTWLTFRG